MKLKFFPRGFFAAKPVHVILLFCLGVVLLSRDSTIQGHKLFMSWEEILKRFPGLPSRAEVVPPKFETSTATNLLVNPPVPGSERRALDRFFRKLETARHGGSVRALHYGDSILWGDNVTQQVRKRLLSHFPNGGRGLVPVTIEDGPHGDYVLGGLDQSGDGWKVDLLITMQYHIMDVGISLRKYTALRDNSWSSLKLWKSEHATGLGILADPSKTRLSVRFVLTNNSVVTQTLPRIASSYTLLTNRIPWKEARISVGRGATLYGYDIRRGSGVTFSPVIRKGICSHDFPNIGIPAFRRQIADWKPDLFIWHFGKNEAGWDRYTIKGHLSGIDWVITNVRAAWPQADILLVGPGPRMNKYGGPLRLFPSVPEMCSNQLAMAQKYGLGYFDTFAALGGPEGFLSLVNRGLAMTDYVHLTVKGGDILGNAIADNILTAWAGWLKNSDDTSLAGLFTKKEIPEHVAAQQQQASSTISFDTVGYGFFLLIVFFAYWLLYYAKLMRVLMLLLASWFFYMTWNPVFIILIIASSVIDYIAGFLIYSAKQHERTWLARFWLVVSLVSNLGLLFFFKYFNLFSDFLGQLGVVDGNAGILSLILPAGISFYTFQTMSYSLDIYRGLLKPIRSFLKFNLFVSFFPQLVAGPIVRAREFIPQLIARPRFDPALITNGFFMIMVGLFKKVVISDFLAVNFADRVFASPGIYSPLEVLLGVYAYGLQIYCDFSGYSDIAIGSAAMLGFKLPLNFNSPYKAHNLQDFWHRWHITLSTWLRDYLYIPLGGNRKGNARTYINLAITMLLGGLWHGAAYRFIIWGALHGLGLGFVRWFQRWRDRRAAARVHASADGVLLRRPPSVGGRVLGWLLTFHFVMFAWIFFRAPDMAIVGEILAKLADLPAMLPDLIGLLNSGFSTAVSSLGTHFSRVAPNVTTAIALALFGGYLLHLVPNRVFERTRTLWMALPAPFQALVLLLFMGLLYKTATAAMVPFIYFQF